MKFVLAAVLVALAASVTWLAILIRYPVVEGDLSQRVTVCRSYTADDRELFPSGMVPDGRSAARIADSLAVIGSEDRPIRRRQLVTDRGDSWVVEERPFGRRVKGGGYIISVDKCSGAPTLVGMTQ